MLNRKAHTTSIAVRHAGRSELYLFKYDARLYKEVVGGHRASGQLAISNKRARAILIPSVQRYCENESQLPISVSQQMSRVIYFQLKLQAFRDQASSSKVHRKIVYD